MFIVFDGQPVPYDFAIQDNERTPLPALVLHELDEGGEGVVCDTTEH
jgi:hypothetical protein